LGVQDFLLVSEKLFLSVDGFICLHPCFHLCVYSSFVCAMTAIAYSFK
jgi:hypothetical protein